jgi:uncharacterized membrane-anchored protein YjiN (DUF445 family)
MINWFVEFVSKMKMNNRRRNLIDKLVERITKSEIFESWGEVVERSIEECTESKMCERRKRKQRLVEILSKNNVCDCQG